MSLYFSATYIEVHSCDSSAGAAGSATLSKWFHTFRSLDEINRKRESFCTFFTAEGTKTLPTLQNWLVRPFYHCMLGGIFGFKRGIRFVFCTPVMLFLRVRKRPISLYKQVQLVNLGVGWIFVDTGQHLHFLGCVFRLYDSVLWKICVNITFGFFGKLKWEIC